MIVKYLYAFGWVFMFEMINNFFAVSGVVNAAQELKKGKRANVIIFSLVSALLAYFSIAIFEERKMRVTTLIPPQPISERLVPVILGSILFAFIIYIFSFYFIAKWSNKSLDIKLGLLLAFIISLFEITIISGIGRSYEIRWMRVLSHTVALAVAFPSAMLLIRKAIDTKEGKGVHWVLLATAAMSVLITFIDYMPYIK